MASRSLQEFVEEVSGGDRLRVEHDFGDGFVRLRTSEAERRQAVQDIQCSEHIVLELLRNSRDAHAAHVFLAVSREGQKRLITAIDDGDGIPVAMHEHVFEPRVTSKLDSSHMDAWGLHGRGMALFSIAENSTSAYVADSSQGHGCSIHVESDISRIPEKVDQSSFPRFELADGGNVNVRGPRNIIRTACEFAIESRDSCAVHIGSPAEIAATLFAYGNETLSEIDRVFCRDVAELPLVKRLATAGDPRDFADMAARLGLDVSERTARRVLDGHISSVPSLLDMIVIKRDPSGHIKPAKPRKRVGGRVRIQKSDTVSLVEAVRDAYTAIAARYYLKSDIEPIVQVSRDRITVSVPIVEDDR